MPTSKQIPPGLILHCTNCGLVVPSDAPTSSGSDCMFVAKHKLAWFNQSETPAGQHVQAVATWALINHAALSVSDPTVTPYHREFQQNRKVHFAASAVRKALTPEQVMDGARHKRDGALYT